MNKQEPQTRKSLYPPIEIKLDGEVFRSRKFTRSLLIETAVYEKVIEFIKKDDSEEDDSEKKVIDPEEEEKCDIELEKKKWDAYCNWMRIVFAVPIEKLEEAEFAEIEDAFIIVKTELIKRQGDRMEKHVGEIKAVTDKIGKATKSVQEVAKNVKGPGEKV